MTLDKFHKLNEEEQVDYLVSELSTLEEVVIFVELARMLNQYISYDVLRRAMTIWEPRLYSSKTGKIKKKYRSQYKTLLGLAIEMKFVGKFSEEYEIEPKMFLESKRKVDNPTTKQRRRMTLRRMSRAKKSGFMVDLPIC